MTATEKETSTSTLFKSLFEELHSYFNENSAHKQKSPLSISRYFSLLTLSERDLSNWDQEFLQNVCVTATSKEV